MYTLKKHKKKGVEGFKDFVKNLETFPASTVKEMLLLGLIEDPVYLKWAMENRISFQYLLSLSQANAMTLFKNINMSFELLAMAFKNTPEEDSFIKQKLPSSLQKQYFQESEYIEPTPQQKVQARTRLMNTLFKLEETGVFEKFTWKIPPVSVLEGEDLKPLEDGEFGVYYTSPLENVLALKGPIEKGLRAGLWGHFYPNGELIAKGFYVSGEKAGQWTFFYPNKSLWLEGKFVDGQKDGLWKEYAADGSFVEIKYQKGNVIST